MFLIKSINKCVFAILCVLFVSCNIINFGQLQLDYSVGENDEFFYNDYLWIKMNYDPEKNVFEDLVCLKVDNQTTSINYIWENSTTLLISPFAGWKKGRHYELSVEGNVKTLEKGMYSVKECRHFTYGCKNEMFFLEKMPCDTLSCGNDSLVFVFNKPVEQSSFNSCVSISPHSDFETVFSNDAKTVSITPKSRWPTNTTLTWNVENTVCASDGYAIIKGYTGIVLPTYNLELPVLLTVCPVSLVNDVYTLLEASSLNSLTDSQGIAFKFSHPMDSESVEKGIKFDPMVKGCLYIVDDNYTTFVFKPYANYALNTEYTLTVSDSCMDQNYMELLDSSEFFFTSANNFLEILSLKVNSVNLLNQNTSAEIEVPLSGVEIVITFSSPIKNLSLCENCISCNLLFPYTIDTPIKESCSWNESHTIVTLLYSGLSSDNLTDLYYQISVKGTSSGVLNANGDYMKETICASFISRMP